MRFCFDMKLMRPGCVLLAAAMGGDTELAKRFSTEIWLLGPTPDLKVYEISKEEFEAAVPKIEAVNRKPKEERHPAAEAYLSRKS